MVGDDKLRKIKYSNVCIIGIFIYIIFQVFTSILSKNIQTIVLENEKTDMKINRKCLIIRDEHLLKSNSDGTLDLLVSEGDRVVKSQKVASVYGDVEEDIDEKISNLEDEIEKLKSGEINISKDEISHYNEKIQEAFINVQEDLLNKDYTNIKEYKDSLDDYLDEKNKLLNNGIDSIKLSTKEEQKRVLENKRKNGVSTYFSSISGIVCYKYDENEEVYNSSNINEITKEDILNAENNYTKSISNKSNVKDGNTILRLVNNANTYVATYISKEELDKLEVNQSIKLSNENIELDGIVHNIFDDGDDFIAIFKINNQNMDIYDTRVEEFDIIYKQIEGLKIPKSSIKVVDEKEGVYVINEENKVTNFIELKGINFEDENYKYINYYNNKVDGIETVDLYDKIILKPNIININMKIK